MFHRNELTASTGSRHANEFEKQKKRKANNALENTLKQPVWCVIFNVILLNGEREKNVNSLQRKKSAFYELRSLPYSDRCMQSDNNKMNSSRQCERKKNECVSLLNQTEKRFGCKQNARIQRAHFQSRIIMVFSAFIALVFFASPLLRSIDDINTLQFILRRHFHLVLLPATTHDL